MKRILHFLMLMLSAIISQGQNEIGTYFMQNLHHSSALNPAFDSNSKWVVSLPSAYGMFNQSGLKIGNLISGDILGLLSDNKNQIAVGSELSLLKISYKRDNLRYNFAHNYKLFADSHFSDPIAQLVYEGNTSFIGGKVSSSPYFNFNFYSEILLGFTYVNNFSAGMNFKFLNGIQNVSTEESNLELSVNDDIYQLAATGNVLINSTFPLEVADSDSSGQFVFDPFPNNYGFAMDLGITYKNGPYTISASILDIGLLTWKDNVRNYVASGTFAFDGIDITDVLDGNSNVIDTIIGAVNFEVENNAFRKYVPTKYYANLNYDINSKYGVGGLIYLHKSGTLNTSIFAINGFRKFNGVHQIGLQYAITNNNYFNLGVNAYTTLGPIRLFAVFDNVFAALNPLGSGFVNGRIGININFGNKKSDISKA